ncbi:flavodoxin family protein [Desulfovibrio ferrophilus]|uniref:NADPH-dependent FMN reductase n=1 Tax=Desulfovibrio ferrophilus TaxID=241368 RepID=A0A2Z6B3C8_9BACT|nr:flavodoxin family protein [Desulfovibrio ferrophilus]BBD09963.1 NADPH-dependent FMN reductase [Desulfovibrio ferrophilus]
MMNSPMPAVISASPRPGGNSDRAAALFARGAEEMVGAEVRVQHLRRFEVHPCTACYRCQHDPSRQCYLSERDQSGALFQQLMTAPSLFLSAPIFFYHLPASFKAWIDRGQSYWLRRREGDSVLTSLPVRPAWVCLVAGRKQGEKTFEGSLLTLKYFLKIFNFEMQTPLTLRGLEGAGDLAVHPGACSALTQLGGEAAKLAMSAGE